MVTRSRWAMRLLVLQIVLGLWVGMLPTSPVSAAAPPRANQPYAEAELCARPEVIFCEDFNYPENFTKTSQGDPNYGPWLTNWINPGLVNGVFGFVYGTEGRQINPASQYPVKPSGAMPSGNQPDHVWVANWDPEKGPANNGSTFGQIRHPGPNGTYANGTPPTNDIYIRFQYYVTPDYAWPGDPKTDKYYFINGTTGCGGIPGVYDNKILYFYPADMTSPTDASYDAGLHTQGCVYSAVDNARFADAIAIRYGDAGEYKFYPGCINCVINGTYQNYFPFQSLALENPNDQKLFRRVFRLNKNKWYTFELRYKLSSGPNVPDGITELWVDGVKIYSETGQRTCGSGSGDTTCSGIGIINLVAYHNAADPTRWDGQQVIDNLVISRSYIGPPRGGSTDTNPPAPPTNLRIQ